MKNTAVANRFIIFLITFVFGVSNHSFGDEGGYKLNKRIVDIPKFQSSEFLVVDNNGSWEIAGKSVSIEMLKVAVGNHKLKSIYCRLGKNGRFEDIEELAEFSLLAGKLFYAHESRGAIDSVSKCINVSLVKK